MTRFSPSQQGAGHLSGIFGGAAIAASPAGCYGGGLGASRGGKSIPSRAASVNLQAAPPSDGSELSGCPASGVPSRLMRW
jgi:hypothetical protein